MEDPPREHVEGGRCLVINPSCCDVFAGPFCARLDADEDASPTSTALMTLQRWMEHIAEKEVERITAKCRRYQEQGKQVPAWVHTGMDERFRRVEQFEQRVQMLLGVFASHGVLPLEFKPAHSVGDLLLQHLDGLEQEVEEK